MDNLESKSRRKEMCIHNIVEKSKGNNMITFLNQLIVEVLGVSGKVNNIQGHCKTIKRIKTRHNRLLLSSLILIPKKGVESSMG